MTGPTSQSIDELVQTALGELQDIDDPESLDQWRVSYLGRRGSLTQVLRGIAQLDVEQRREAGALGNQAKRNLEERLEQRVQEVNQAHLEQTFARDQLDVTLPGRPSPIGRLHPTTQIIREICDAFAAMGFSIVEGPEVEWDHYNFEMLNIPKDHSARDMWDTLYVADSKNHVIREIDLANQNVKTLVGTGDQSGQDSEYRHDGEQLGKGKAHCPFQISCVPSCGVHTQLSRL